MILLPLILALTLPSATYKDPRLAYTLHFDTTDLTGISVELRVRNAPRSMQIAANAHPEYDDKYWRYVENLTARSGSGQSIGFSRIDSVRWQLNNPAGDVIVSYRVKFPDQGSPRPAWKPFLSRTAALVGGPHSFLYPIGLEKEQATVILDIPSAWTVGTGLSRNGPTSTRNFIAPDVHTLMESPMLIGKLSRWTFTAGNVPHHVYYSRTSNSKSFDTTAFVSGIQKLANQAVDLFGSTPYREYSFLFQDAAWDGGLEHPNSVTLGAQSEELAKDPNYTLRETAHEFFHTWNLMAIKPAEYREVDYRIQPPVAELWFSEGLTIFYGDLIQRRAGLPTEDSTRLQHLAQAIERYHTMPGLSRFSAEQVSRVEYNASQDALGDYVTSSHLQGELLGTILDLKIRDATNGAKSMDDVMRLMYQRFRTRKFTSRDVQSAVDDVCACNTASIFNQHVFNAGAIDFNRYLAPIGLKTSVTWSPALMPDGKPQPDLRAWGYESGGRLKFRVTDPSSVWAKAGLHTGDDVVSVNGKEMKTWPELRSVLRNLKVGDSTSLVVRRGGQTISRTVVVTGYNRPTVRIDPISGTSPRQIRLRTEWLVGATAHSRR